MPERWCWRGMEYRSPKYHLSVFWNAFTAPHAIFLQNLKKEGVKIFEQFIMATFAFALFFHPFQPKSPFVNYFLFRGGGGVEMF